MRLFLSAPHPPTLLGRGLYAGLKSRGGLPTPLPVLLENEFYVNAGLIDGLSTALIRTLSLTDVNLRVTARGPLLMQWYFLDSFGAIRHYMDHRAIPFDACAQTEHNIPVPSILLEDDNIVLVFFRITSAADSEIAGGCELLDWCFHAEYRTPEVIRPLLLISRTLSESKSLINQYHNHCLHYRELAKRFPDLIFLPMPRLHLYESDDSAYRLSVRHLQDLKTSCPAINDWVKLCHNPFNLGGGGNMCYAVKMSMVDTNYDGNFVLFDSDTLVPFKTLYTSALIGELRLHDKSQPEVISPVIAYRKYPTKILEAGAIFGRGTWQLAFNKAVQPCIFPFQQGADLTDKHVQSHLAQSQITDYPPFIYSLYHLGHGGIGKDHLPAPFFLRGDDVEYGLHLRNQGISTSVQGYLFVFQDPKHSPCHEVMAILHSLVILIAYTETSELDVLSSNLSKFFEARLSAHASVRDLHGISLYAEVLRRLLSLLDVCKDKLLAHFYDPDYYASIRTLNANYTRSNYQLAINMRAAASHEVFRELPFLYFSPLQPEESLPESLFLMNHLAETAAVLHPARTQLPELQSSAQCFRYDLMKFISELASIQHCCQALLDRNLILENYEAHYSKSGYLENSKL